MHLAFDRVVAFDAMPRRLLFAIALLTFALGVQAQDRCSATGVMAGLKFAANNCVAALYGSQHGVSIWFNEDPISPQEAADFQASGTVDVAKNGQQRTLVLIMLCPGGGTTKASPAAVKSMGLTTNHAKSVLAGIEWNVKSPKDFKVAHMTGDIVPGGTLAGDHVGRWHKTTWNLSFDVKLPAKDAAIGMDCAK